MPLPDLPPLNYDASQWVASRLAASQLGSTIGMQGISKHQQGLEHCRSNPTHLPPENHPPLKILLAEDNLTNQKLALRQLQILGYPADVVADGWAAVEAVIRSGYDRSGYDIVLMDCQMPILNGFDATMAIRAWEREAAHRAKPIVIVAMTASDMEQDRERAIAVGMNDYLMKPVHKETLKFLLQQWSESIVAMELEYYQLPSNMIEERQHELLKTQLGIDDLHLNLEHLHTLSENTPEFEAELLQLFVDDSNFHLKKLEHALASQDFRQIEQIAHHLKGASANVGAMIMRRTAEALEIQASQRRNDRLHILAATLETSLKQIHLLMGLKTAQ